MPVYPYRCDNNDCEKHGGEQDIFKGVSDASKPERCYNCGQNMSRVYSLAQAIPFEPYYHEEYKTTINSRSQEDREMKRHGHVRSYEAWGYKYKDRIKEAKWKQAHGYGKHGCAKKET